MRPSPGAIDTAVNAYESRRIAFRSLVLQGIGVAFRNSAPRPGLARRAAAPKLCPSSAIGSGVCPQRSSWKQGVRQLHRRGTRTSAKCGLAIPAPADRAVGVKLADDVRAPRGIVVVIAISAAVVAGVAANPEQFPGSVPVAVGVAATVLGLVVIMALIEVGKLGTRGHSGNLDSTPWDDERTPWWRSSARLTPATIAAVFVGRAIGQFDHLVGVVVFALLAATVTVWFVLAAETSDPEPGNNAEDHPLLGNEARAYAEFGELESEVLELLALQGHRSERQLPWCALAGYG